MKNKMIVQKGFYYAFLIMEAVMFLYALVFMTDFSDLFSLMMAANEPIAEFHDVLMQNFNQMAFICAIFGIFAFIFSKFLQINTHIPDVFAVAVMAACALVLIGFSCYAIVALQTLQSVYIGLDFSSLYLEGGSSDYAVELRTFTAGKVLYCVQITLVVAYVADLLANHKTYKKLYGGASA
ncbi:MAG: hypothetical protein R3Y06_09050 [Faecalibacterium sp.]